jgi:hypothetical protein
MSEANGFTSVWILLGCFLADYSALKKLKILPNYFSTNTNYSNTSFGDFKTKLVYKKIFDFLMKKHLNIKKKIFVFVGRNYS